MYTHTHTHTHAHTPMELVTYVLWRVKKVGKKGLFQGVWSLSKLRKWRCPWKGHQFSGWIKIPDRFLKWQQRWQKRKGWLWANLTSFIISAAVWPNWSSNTCPTCLTRWLYESNAKRDVNSFLQYKIWLKWGNSLVVQWLGLCACTAGGTGSIPGWGTRILHTAWHGQKKQINKIKCDLNVRMGLLPSVGQEMRILAPHSRGD